MIYCKFFIKKNIESEQEELFPLHSILPAPPEIGDHINYGASRWTVATVVDRVWHLGYDRPYAAIFMQPTRTGRRDIARS